MDDLRDIAMTVAIVPEHTLSTLLSSIVSIPPKERLLLIIYNDQQIFYALVRERGSVRTQNTVGKTHPKWGNVHPK